MKITLIFNNKFAKGLLATCESFNYGEVEDYIVVIGGTNPIYQGITVGTINNTVLGNPSGSTMFRIYPNPVKGNTLNVEVLNNNATDYVIYNLVGQIVAKNTYTNTIDVSLLQSGGYLIQVNVGDEKFIERFIKE